MSRALQELRSRFEDVPGTARGPDAPATAVVEGLLASAIGADGATMTSDMPEEYGGSDAAPSPGWYFRAAAASCEAMVIAMRAASQGLELSELEVTVSSESDARGLLGTSDSVPPGPLSSRIDVRIGSKEASEAELREIVAWASAHSPLTDAIERAIPTTVEIDVVKSG
jgi:uncharacterized OsmC-like protein